MNIYRSWRPPILPGEARNGVWERWIAPSRGAFYSQFRRHYGQSPVRIDGVSRLQTQGWISLQMGKPWNCTSRMAVRARHIRKARGPGALECEVWWEGGWRRAGKWKDTVEWMLC